MFHTLKKLNFVQLRGRTLVFVAEIVQTYCDDAYVIDGHIAMDKVRPLLFMTGDRSYYSLGSKLGAAWSLGEELLNK